MKETMNKRKKSLLASLLLGLIALLGFHSCSTPEEIETNPYVRNDSVGNIRLMYGVPPRGYIQERK